MVEDFYGLSKNYD